MGIGFEYRWCDGRGVHSDKDIEIRHACPGTEFEKEIFEVRSSAHRWCSSITVRVRDYYSDSSPRREETRGVEDKVRLLTDDSVQAPDLKNLMTVSDLKFPALEESKSDLNNYLKSMTRSERVLHLKLKFVCANISGKEGVIRDFAKRFCTRTPCLLMQRYDGSTLAGFLLRFPETAILSKFKTPIVLWSVRLEPPPGAVGKVVEVVSPLRGL